MRVALIAGLIAGSLLAATAHGEEGGTSLAAKWRAIRAELHDPVDNQFDVSPILERAHGFLPIPVIVTEPAVGYGGGMVAMFVQPRHEAGREGFARPDLSALGFVATSNGTRVALAGDSRLWRDGRLKTLVGGLAGNVNLDAHGLGTTATDADLAVRYTLDTRGVGGTVDWQLAPGMPWWVSLRYVYADVEPKLRDLPVLPNLEDRVRSTITGPGAALIYDSRDNIFTPTRGLYSETSIIDSDEAFGANRNFRRYGQVLMGWWPAAPTVTLAARLDWTHATDGAPFFVRPFIALRGIPAMRYPGDTVTTGQVEGRWQFYGRWSVVAFGGVGVARLDHPFERDKTAGAGGVGFRYELASKFGMHVGIDVARGPEESAVYLQVGNAWFRP